MAWLSPPPLPRNFCLLSFGPFLFFTTRGWGLKMLVSWPGTTWWNLSHPGLKKRGCAWEPLHVPGQQQTRKRRQKLSCITEAPEMGGLRNGKLSLRPGDPGCPWPSPVTSILRFSLSLAPKSDWQKMALGRWKWKIKFSNNNTRGKKTKATNFLLFFF